MSYVAGDRLLREWECTLRANGWGGEATCSVEERREDLRGALSLVDLITSLKQRRPPTELLIRRKIDALSRPTVELLPFMVENVVAAKHGRLSPHQRDGLSRAVCDFPTETAAESAHVHACGAAASEEAVGFARDQASHLLRIGLEHCAVARRMGCPLCPIATDRHTMAMAELAKGGEGSEKAALGRLGVCGTTVVEGGLFASASGGLLLGIAFYVAMTDHQIGGSLDAIRCGSCHRVVRGDELSICRRCGEHLFCEVCLAGDGPARHATECGRVRSRVRSLAQSMLPRVRESTRRVAVVQLNDSGVVVPMHISSITSPILASSLLDSLLRGPVIDSHSEVVVYWRLLVAFLAEPEGDAQEPIKHEGAVHRVDPVECAVVEDRAGGVRKAPTLRSSEKRRLQKEKDAAKRKANDDARVAAEALAVAEANAVLERQSARADAMSAMLTSVLLKRGGTASPEVVARIRTKRNSLKVAEMRARKPAKAKREEPNAAERVRIDGDLTNDRLDAALLLQRCVRAWLRCRKKARRRQRSRAAKRIQSSVRTWLLTRRARVTGVGECKAEPARSDPAGPPPCAVEEGGDASCVVCLERPRAVVLLPCRHLSMCALCAAGVSTCPMCRSAVEESMVVFV